MKKIWSVIFMLLIVVLFAGCEARDNSNDNTNVNASVSSTETTNENESVATGTTPTPPNALYQHDFFKINYVDGWRVEAEIEKYSSVAAAESAGGNYVHFFNYGAEKYLGGEPFQAGDHKIDLYVFDNLQASSLDEFMQQQLSNTTLISSETLVGSATPAKKALIDGAFGDVTSVYFFENNNGAVLIYYPPDTEVEPEFEAIAKTLQFN